MIGLENDTLGPLPPNLSVPSSTGLVDFTVLLGRVVREVSDERNNRFGSELFEEVWRHDSLGHLRSSDRSDGVCVDVVL